MQSAVEKEQVAMSDISSTREEQVAMSDISSTTPLLPALASQITASSGVIPGWMFGRHPILITVKP